MPSISRYYSSTAAKTTLSSAIDSSSASLLLAAASGLPSQYPFTLILEKDTANEEIVEVTGLVGSAYTITRGVDGTSAKSHSIGAVVEHGVSARDFAESRSHEAATSAHGVTGDIVGTGGAQTLASKTLTSPTVNTPTIAGGTLTGTITSSATVNVTGSIVVTGGTITGLSSTSMVASSATPKNYVDAILGSATAASTSAASAATSATSAATSASSAATSATAAATSAASALTSQTAAATSAASALTSQTAAATSAASALTSQTSAATSATSAAASATAAATSASSAATSASSAAASFDSFDDRYLGAKSADPTLDNDGNALIAGALYFNSGLPGMKVYTGSAWQLVAPDTSNFIDKSSFGAKGDVLAGTASGAFTALTVATTSGYILSVNSSTATGLEWVAPNPGDITGVTAGTGLSGGGTSGTVTLNISDSYTDETKINAIMGVF